MLIKNVKSSDGFYLIRSNKNDGFAAYSVFGYVTWCTLKQYNETTWNLKELHVTDDFNPNVSDCLGEDNYITYDIVEQGEHEVNAPQYVYVVTQTKLESKDNMFTASSRVIDVCESADKAIEVAQGFTETSIVKMEVKK